MATKAKAKADGLEDCPQFVTHREVAKKLGVKASVLRDWVVKGNFPEAHSSIERTWLYRVDLIRAFLESGKWPKGTKFRHGVGRGRCTD